jgi:hypothetical protein
MIARHRHPYNKTATKRKALGSGEPLQCLPLRRWSASLPPLYLLIGRPSIPPEK